jgi:lipopolysaccharide transport system ATP-binding protein
MELVGVGLRYSQRHSLFRHTEFTALKDINLTIYEGETLGIIGHNGSGKSTLLRVMASIYTPDTGRVVRHCQSVSLLSLGLGFDAQMSGIDNAIILGMLLGARKAEVLAKLDEIIEFAELGQFIYEPLKTYSTGMRSRLGFSVAVKMQASMLLIGEVLSVGDASFRRKAERAMSDLIASDQTVVLVSHSLSQMKNLCDRVLWLKNGSVHACGIASEVLADYDS